MKEIILESIATFIVFCLIAAIMFGWTAFFFDQASTTTNPGFMQFIGCMNWVVAILVLACRTLDKGTKSH